MRKLAEIKGWGYGVLLQIFAPPDMIRQIRAKIGSFWIPCLIRGVVLLYILKPQLSELTTTNRLSQNGELLEIEFSQFNNYFPQGNAKGVSISFLRDSERLANLMSRGGGLNE